MAFPGGDFNNPDIDAFGDNILLVLKMEEAAGVSKVNSVTGGQGPFPEFNGPIPSVAAKSGNGVDYEADSSQFLKNSSGDLTAGKQVISFSGWVNIESLTGGPGVIYESTGTTALLRYQIVILPTGAIQLGMRDAEVGSVILQTTAAGVISTGSFQHIVAIINTASSTMKVFVDNVSKLNVSVPMGTFASVASADGTRIGRLQDAAADFADGIYDEFYLWDAELSSAAITALFNSGAGRFWTVDAVAPALPDKVVRCRLQDANLEFHTGITWRNPTDADFRNAEIGRAISSVASTPTHILEDQGDGTVDWVLLASSTDPYRLAGANADTSPLQTELDRFGAWADPDQANDDAAFFVRSVDVAGNISAFVKAVDGTGLLAPTVLPTALVVDIAT